MEYKIKVTKEFLDHREKHSKLYNQGSRTHEAFLKDLDCEIFEWDQINNGNWTEYTGNQEWKVDAIDDNNERVEVKFMSSRSTGVKKWWSFGKKRAINLIRQAKSVDYYMFMEWVEVPKRPLEEGDEVICRVLARLSQEELAGKICVGKHDPFCVKIK